MPALPGRRPPFMRGSSVVKMRAMLARRPVGAMIRHGERFGEAFALAIARARD